MSAQPPEPLSGKRIVVTRSRVQAEGFSRKLAVLGAVPIVFPTIEIVPPDNCRALDAALHAIASYDWLIFTSVNGVEAFWQRAESLGLSLRQNELKASIAVIGPATAAALNAHGRQPTLIPKYYVAEAIAGEIGDVYGKKVLLPRAEIARDALAVELGQRGAVVDDVVAYRTLLATPDPNALAAIQQGVDAITFTSSSTVRNFVALSRQAKLEANNAVIACIGPVTADTARKAGLQVTLTADVYTTAGLIEALIQHYR